MGCSGFVKKLEHRVKFSWNQLLEWNVRSISTFGGANVHCNNAFIVCIKDHVQEKLVFAMLNLKYRLIN